ncbi:MAG: hypothetical protein J6M53_05790 [Bacteroidaceae bacterium]|nr:hypothetical protein [Bacteroidaceae bacterium]
MKFLAAHTAHSPATYFTLPDTALTQGGKPFFLPEDAEAGGGCEALPCVALRIDRQGRSIGARFAGRYYSQAAPSCRFVLPARLQRLRREGLPWDEAVGFDGAVCVGTFSPVETGETLHVSVAGHGLEITPDAIHAHIAAASRIFTFHQGDILLLSDGAAPFPATIGRHIDGTLQGAPALSFNVK